MKKMILAASVAALTATTAYAGSPAAGADDSDPYVPVEVAAASSSAGGAATAAAVVGGLLLIGALAGSDSDSSTGSD